MTAFSKSKRHKIYKSCLNWIEVNEDFCICPFLMERYKLQTTALLEYKFPDLWKYRPKDIEGWRPWFNQKRRIEVLKELIKATE